MELILIGDDKLKIMLSEEDMEKYHINGDELDYSKLSTRTVIKSILSDAKTMTGFDTEGGGFFVQLFTSAHGGCELFVTKSDMCPIETQNNKINPQKQKTDCSLVYSFNSFFDLISACRRLHLQNTDVYSVAYADVNGKYFLSLFHGDDSLRHKLNKFTFLGEYGKCENTNTFQMYCGEYCIWVCKDAVPILGTF